MTLLTEATDVFAAAESSGRCVVAFLAKRQPVASGAFGTREREAIAAVLARLAGRTLASFRAGHVRRPGQRSSPWRFDTGFAHAVDFAGAFEAPSLSAALAGTVRLEQAGWSRRFATEWLLGPREFATVGGLGDAARHEWGFLAFWEWNDAWAAASGPRATRLRRSNATSPSRATWRSTSALQAAIGSIGRVPGITSASGKRHRWPRSTRPCAGHEHAADFKFTTSRHVIGKRRPSGRADRGGVKPS